MSFKRGDHVKIVNGFYANETFEIARKNNINDYTGIGEITKIPSEDDHLNYRNNNENKLWKKKCPVNYLKRKILKEHNYSEKKLSKIEKVIELRVLKYFKKASNEALPGRCLRSTISPTHIFIPKINYANL